MTALLLFDLDGTLLLTGGAGLRAMNRSGKQLFGPHFSFDSVVVAGGLDPQLFAQAARASGVSNPDAHHDTFHDLYLKTLAEELATHRDKAHPLPGIPALLDTLCRREGVTVGLVTGNYRKAAPLKLEAAGIDPKCFTVTAFGDEAADRTALVALAIDRHGRTTPRHPQPTPHRRPAAAGDRRATPHSRPATPGHPQQTPHRRPAAAGDRHSSHTALDRPSGRTALDRQDPIIVIGDTPTDVAAAHANAAYCVAVATGTYEEQQLKDAGADLTLASFADPDPFFQFLSQTSHFTGRSARPRK